MRIFLKFQMAITIHLEHILRYKIVDLSYILSNIVKKGSKYKQFPIINYYYFTGNNVII